MGEIRVAACQVRLDITRPAGSAAHALSRAAAAAAYSDLVVLPELANTGYCFRDRDEAWALAEPLDGPFVSALADISARHDAVVVSGVAERDGAGVRNTAVVLDRGDLVAVHRKVHLWDAEKEVFRPGDELAPVVDTSVGRLAPLVCYDLEFVELVAPAAAAGAHVIVAPVNWPAVGRVPDGERPMDVVRAQAMAALHRVFVVVADRCGTERGQRWIGGSVICGPDGYPLAGPAGADEEAVLSCRFDPAIAGDKGLSTRNDLVTDRRPEVYARPIRGAGTAQSSGTNHGPSGPGDSATLSGSQGKDGAITPELPEERRIGGSAH